jgi:hypothetical protein
MNADMAKVLDCGICPDTRNTLAIVQTVPWFTVEKKNERKKNTKSKWLSKLSFQEKI